MNYNIFSLDYLIDTNWTSAMHIFNHPIVIVLDKNISLLVNWVDVIISDNLLIFIQNSVLLKQKDMIRKIVYLN